MDKFIISTIVVRFSIAGVLLVLFCYFYRAYSKEKRLCRGTQILLDLHHKVVALETEFQDYDYSHCLTKMIQLCSKISKSFTEVKGTQISVCIKYINAISNIEYVETLARDFQSLDDNKRQYPVTHKDKLNDNSDFRCLMLRHSTSESGRQWKDIYYLQNNIPNAYGYYNSHLNEEELPKGILGVIYRHIKWELPYKSTLIVPIVNQADDSFYGFLCIDSKRIWGFNNMKDVELLRDAALCIWRIVNITLIKNQIKASNNGQNA